MEKHAIAANRVALLAVLVAAASAASAAPQRQGRAGPVAAAPVAAAYPAPIPVLRRSEVHDQAGQFELAFETGNGITVEEQGALKKNADGEFKGDVVLVKRGSYSYPGADGRLYRVTYIADETGFHASGDHLPVAPQPPGPSSGTGTVRVFKREVRPPPPTPPHSSKKRRD